MARELQPLVPLGDPSLLHLLGAEDLPSPTCMRRCGGLWGNPCWPKCFEGTRKNAVSGVLCKGPDPDTPCSPSCLSMGPEQVQHLLRWPSQTQSIPATHCTRVRAELKQLIPLKMGVEIKERGKE